MMKPNTSDDARPLPIPTGDFGRKVFRLDPPADEAEKPEPATAVVGTEGPGLVRTILQAIRPARRDRRRFPRHEPVEPEVWIGWRWEDGFLAVPGRLTD